MYDQIPMHLCNVSAIPVEKPVEEKKPVLTEKVVYGKYGALDGGGGGPDFTCRF